MRWTSLLPALTPEPNQSLIEYYPLFTTSHKMTLNLFFVFTEKENPYEDVDLKRRSLSRKSGLSENSRSWAAMDRKLNSPPQVSPSVVSIISWICNI